MFFSLTIHSSSQGLALEKHLCPAKVSRAKVLFSFRKPCKELLSILSRCEIQIGNFFEKEFLWQL